MALEIKDVPSKKVLKKSFSCLLDEKEKFKIMRGSGVLEIDDKKIEITIPDGYELSLRIDLTGSLIPKETE